MESAWNRSVLRTNNERLLLDRLRADGATSRAELARITGLSKPTVSTALGRLEIGGLVREIGKQAVAGRGRSPVLYEADPRAGYALGVDVGRSWIRVAVADLDGVVHARHDERNTADDADGIVAMVVALCRRMAAESGIRMADVLHTVVASPGVIDSVTHEVRTAVAGSAGADRLQKELGTGLDLLNDANLAALGEYSAGAGRGRSLFVYILVGTGIGAGIVVDGKLFPGAHGAAGEVAYLPWGNGESTGAAAPSRGLLEDAAAGDAVVGMARALGMTDASTAKEIFDAARAGDATAMKVVHKEAERLAHGVAAVAAVLDPELIVLGGGIGDSADLLLDPLRAALLRITPLQLEVAASELGDKAVLQGAVATAVDIVRERVFEAWQAAQGPDRNGTAE